MLQSHANSLANPDQNVTARERKRRIDKFFYDVDCEEEKTRWQRAGRARARAEHSGESNNESSRAVIKYDSSVAFACEILF